MNHSSLSALSLSRLEGVHPDLVRVVKNAVALCAAPFCVAEGRRDMQTQKHYVATGKSRTLNSKHLPQADGFSHAVDLLPLRAPTTDPKSYLPLAAAMKNAAAASGIDIIWGGDWKNFVDCPHFELKQK